MIGVPSTHPPYLAHRIKLTERIFLLCAVDVYRNKAGSTIAARGQEISTVAPHLETRIGKKMWMERKNNKRATSRES